MRSIELACPVRGAAIGHATSAQVCVCGITPHAPSRRHLVSAKIAAFACAQVRSAERFRMDTHATGTAHAAIDGAQVVHIVSSALPVSLLLDPLRARFILDKKLGARGRPGASIVCNLFLVRQLLFLVAHLLPVTRGDQLLMGFVGEEYCHKKIACRYAQTYAKHAKLRSARRGGLTAGQGSGCQPAARAW